jgi:UPF0755 protein
LLLLVACSLADPPEVVTRPGPFVFEVQKGATAKGLGPALEAEGLIASGSRWGWFLRLGADGSCLKAGRHSVAQTMSPSELLAALCGVPIADDIPFTVVEGWRARDIDAALAAKGLAPPGAYLEATRTAQGYDAPFPLHAGGLEGYLYPETYLVSPTAVDPRRLVQRQLDLFGERFPEASGTLPRPLHDIVVMASMLEREEPRPENRPLVAGILWKRIGAGWNLGVDATSRYTLDDWSDRAAFLWKLRDPDDPWNTRLRPGLPPTAIGNPSVASLRAAASPVESEYWYYLHDSQQTLHPSRNVREHEAYRAKYGVY